MLEPHQRRRIIGLIATAVAVEIGLFALARLAPAMGALCRMGMFVAGGAFAVAIWHASRSRAGQDRRQVDRRD
jgi:hypothetical protein